MSTSLPELLGRPRRRFGLIPRLGVIAAVLVVETLLFSFFVQGRGIGNLTGFAALVHDIQHWLFRFMIAYAASFAMLVYLRGAATLGAATGSDAPLRARWFVVHALLLLPFAVLCAALYRDLLALPFALLALTWHVCALATALALFAAMAPLPIWARALRQTGALPVYALLPAAAALLAIKGSQLLWAPAAAATFHLVRMILSPFCPSLHSRLSTLTIGTDHFAVTIAQACSGLEGMGLMLAFCTAWLWYFRREYYFPRALLIVPLAVLLMFVLNAVRIAALLLIGDAGYPRIATVGFHSQAGWIAFNSAAFGVAILARRSAWLNRTARQSRAGAQNATAAYLLPLLAILAAGMLAHALSTGFDLLYPLRLVAGAAVLFAYRHRYRGLDWQASWRGVVTGAALFALWAGFAHFLAPAAMPVELAHLPAPLRAGWIVCRVAAATLTVPIAEELAYRGYLLRRLVRADFETVAWRESGRLPLLLSALAFGITHGTLWLAGTLAGLAYGMLAVKTAKIGESIIAHATTNALLAAYVLTFEQWQLW